MNNLMAEIKDDLISRREVINELNDCAELLRCVLDNVDIVGAEREKYKCELRIIEAFISDVQEFPSMQLERKRGNWKYNGKSGTFKIFTCDQCGRNSEAEFNFCSNCGADMRGDSDEAD